MWLRSQETKKVQDPEVGARKKRKIDSSPIKKGTEKVKPSKISPKQSGTTQVDKLDLIKRVGDSLNASWDRLEKMGDPALELMHGYDLGAYAMEVLDELEKSRQTSQAFTKGTLQGALKRGYQKPTRKRSGLDGQWPKLRC